MDWAPEMLTDDRSIAKLNRRIQLKFPGSAVQLTSEDVLEARKAAFDFLDRQAGGKDNGGLNLHKGASITLHPRTAKGVFSVEIGNNSAEFGTVRPMTREFASKFQSNRDPIWVEAKVGRHLELRNERTGLEYERRGRLTQSGQRETIYDYSPSYQRAEIAKEQDVRVAVCR